MKTHPIHQIPNLSFVEQIYYNNTKLAIKVFKNKFPIDGKYTKLHLNEDMYIRVGLRHPDENEFQFEPIDSLIFDAICSLYSNNIQIFTPDMIARIMYHDAHHRFHKNVLKQIESRIDSMCELQICLDITSEIATREELPKADQLHKAKYCKFLQLEMVFATHIDNGKTCFAYRFCRAPLLWEYARYTRQIVSCRYGAFHLEDHSTSIESLLILRYVHVRISEMRNKKTIYIVEKLVSSGLIPQNMLMDYWQLAVYHQTTIAIGMTNIAKSAN